MSQLGIVTYNIAKDWDLPTILARLEKLGYAGVIGCEYSPAAGTIEGLSWMKSLATD